MKAYTDLHKSYINGEWRDGNGKQSIDTINPFTGETIFAFQTVSESDIDEAYEAALKAQ